MPTAFLSGSAGTSEWLLLFGVILVLFGPRRLPEIARTVGRWMHEARRAANEFRDQIMSLDGSADDATGRHVPPVLPPRPLPPGGIHRQPPDVLASADAPADTPVLGEVPPRGAGSGHVPPPQDPKA
ncbi:MAG: twin-arginine translocase TatA/TatE family subunit [Lentisphaerae bacterium]|nr:twin-arginine translocase TatA/TatE family subunit [Lentisphaerota bacterium]